MAITLYMLVEIVRGSFTGRGDRSEYTDSRKKPEVAPKRGLIALVRYPVNIQSNMANEEEK